MPIKLTVENIATYDGLERGTASARDRERERERVRK